MIVRSNVGAIRSLLQALAIEDRDSSAPMRDEAGFFQGLQRDGDARAVRPEHQPKKLMCQRKLIIVDAVVCHEKPARETLFDFAAAVCQSSCGGLRACLESS